MLLLAIVAYLAPVSGQGKRPPAGARRAARSTLGFSEGSGARLSGGEIGRAERSGDPRRDKRSAAPLLTGERVLIDFCDSFPRGDCAFVPTGISPGPQRFSGWNLENEGLPRGVCSYLLAGTGPVRHAAPSAIFHLQLPTGAGDPIPLRARGCWPEPPSISDETPSRGDPLETAAFDTDHLRSQIRPRGGIGREGESD